MNPQLAHTIDWNHLGTFLPRTDWWFEQKLDGVRLMLLVENGDVTGINRCGTQTPVSRRIGDAFADFKTSWLLDGELLGDTLWLFDLPEVSGFVTIDTPYWKRRFFLAGVYERILTKRTDKIRLLPSFQSEMEKAYLIKECIQKNSEGIIVKNSNAGYSPGERSKDMLKAKQYKSVDCFVDTMWRDNKRSVGVSVYGDNGPVNIGSVGVTEKMLGRLEVGDVIEVRYLYSTSDLRIYQPVFLKKRTDRTQESCHIDQLRICNKEVLTL